ncbi:MAG: class GN sortase [Acidipila sp.]|nr:class GN sortase [Acidipila sp.]
MKVLRILASLILIAGVGLTGYALYMHAKAMLAGVLIRRAWEQSLQSGEARAPWAWADTHPVARLQIPRLEYDEIVLEGATPRTLAFGPARLLSGAGLGKPGNLLLAGHRTSWFRRLEAIVPGDRVQIAWMDSRRVALVERTYAVKIIRVVEPQDVALLAPTAEDALTLVTCYPFGRGPRSPQRYVIRASPLGPSHLTESPAAGSPAPESPAASLFHYLFFPGREKSTRHLHPLRVSSPRADQ